MLYSEIIAVCSEIHTKHINTLCGQNVELLNVKHGGTYSNHWALKCSGPLKTDVHVSCYFIENTVPLHYIDQSVNAVQGNNRCCEVYDTHQCTVRAVHRP
jgi:hypothetical protein